MRIGRLIDPRFQDIVRKLQATHIPLKGAYKLKGVVKAIDEELVKYEELRVLAVEKFGLRLESGELDKDENGGVKFSDENRKAFVAEINDLMSLNVPIAKISINDLGDKVSMSVEDLFFIEDLLED